MMRKAQWMYIQTNVKTFCSNLMLKARISRTHPVQPHPPAWSAQAGLCPVELGASPPVETPQALGNKMLDHLHRKNVFFIRLF